jgi:hypothetical protein
MGGSRNVCRFLCFLKGVLTILDLKLLVSGKVLLDT